MAEKITISAPFSQETRSLGRIGRVGENLSRQIVFDCSSALTDRPNANIICVIQRTGDKEPYAAQMTRVGDTGSYKLVLTSTEVAKSGSVRFELRMVDGDEILKAAIYTGTVEASMSGIGDTPGEPIPDALNRLESAITEVGKYADLKEKVDALESDQITAEDPTETEEVQSSLESILQAIQQKGEEYLKAMQDKADSATSVKTAVAETVYCWGDSLTEGVGGWDSDSFIISAYPDQLHCPHVNLGCRGDDIQTIMARQGADPIVLTTAVTLPASRDESVQIGTMTKPFTRSEGAGLTTKSGETVKPCLEKEAGINPCLVSGVECELYRELTGTLDNDTTYSYKLRRLTDGEAVTLAKGTEIQTYASRFYRNGYAIIWMGANGRAASHQEYVQKIKQMVAYGKYKNYLVLLCREYAEQWVFDGTGYQGIQSLLTDEDGTCHLLYLTPELIRRGYLLAGLSTQGIDTSAWTTTDAILKAAPKLMCAHDTNNAESSFETLHFSKWGYRAIGKLADERITALMAATKATETPEPDPEPEVPTSDEYGTYRYKLPKETTFTGSTYLDTGVKLWENGEADNWCICIAYSGTPTSEEGLPYVLADCIMDGSAMQGFLIRQGGENESWTIFAGSGAIRIDLSMDYTGKEWSSIINEGGTNVVVVSKEGTNYSIYMNGYKAYNSALGYAFNTDNPIPTDVSLIFAGRHVGNIINQKTSFVLKDARVYNTAISDANVAKITNELLSL